MKTVDEVKDYLCERGYEEALVFEKMCESLMDEDGMEYIDAVEFIEYNTIRALPYMGEMAPVVMYPVMD